MKKQPGGLSRVLPFLLSTPFLTVLSPDSVDHSFAL